MANLITLIRLLLVFVISAIALYATTPWQLLNSPLIIINILLDGLDGIIARKRCESSIFGALFDIATDRIIEITLWLVLAKLNMISVWVAIIFVARGILVDALRKPHANSGKTPFGIMQTSIGKFLVASRTMRFAYGFFKVATFAWLFFLIPAVQIWPQLANHYQLLCAYLSNILVAITVFICLIRGIPVILEQLYFFKNEQEKFEII